nr:MAG TPA: N-deoxyribosyltransferase [Caudoviricetes sp.]
MNSQDKAVEAVKKLAQTAYLIDGDDIAYIIEGKKVYLSGPITGKKNYKGLFLFAEELAKMCDVSRIYNPASDIPNSFSYEEAMKRCVTALAEYDTIMLLPGWRSSKGAKIEYDIACACGMDVVGLTDYRLTYCLCDAAYVALLRLL